MGRPKEETAEIERHKYFLSEKMGFDVGWEYAENDWEEQYAAAWRSTQNGGACCTGQRDAAGEYESVAQHEPVQREPVEQHAVPEAVTPATRPVTKPQGSFRSFFARVFRPSR